MLLIFDKAGAGRVQLEPTRKLIGRKASLRGEVAEEVDLGTIRDIILSPRGGMWWTTFVVFEDGTERGKWINVDHGYSALSMRETTR